MEILEDPVFKSQYQKCKLRVKLWESDFAVEHGRKPNKNDIKEADIKIKESYKMYWKLKTRALEETLMDITFSDEVQNNVCTESLTQSSIEVTEQEKKTNTDNAKTDTENIDPHPLNQPTPTENIVVPDTEHKNVKGVWGTHLNKGNEQLPKTKQKLLVGRSTSFQLSQNKFTNSSFTKRNPRKLLSMPKLKSKSDKNIDNNTNMTEQTDADSQQSTNVNEEAKPIFGEAVKVTFMEAKLGGQSINTVQQLIEGHTVNRNLNPGWLDRCSRQSNLEYPVPIDTQRLSGTSDSGLESMESSIYSPIESRAPLEPSKSLQISDEEDFVCNSDSEEERKNKRIRNFKKRLSDQEIHASKRLCVDSNISFTSTPQMLCEMSVTEDSCTFRVTNNLVGNQNNDFNNTNVNTVHQSDFLRPNIDNNLENVTTCTNLMRKNDESNVQMTDTVLSNEKKSNNSTDENTTTVEKPVRRRVVRRRIKQISSDDSDPDFTVADEKPAKKRESKTRTQARPARKVKTDVEKSNTKASRKESTTKTKTKTKTSSRKKKNAEDEIENETHSKTGKENNEAIYGVETLQAVPRFAMRANSGGNLIEQFSKSVSTKTSHTDICTDSAKPKGKLTSKEELEKKVADGRVNENFVRINLKKKVFVRGKKNFNFSKYKKNQWKQRKKELGSGEGSLDVADLIEKNGGKKGCFKCGGTGHFARFCPASKGEDLIPLDDVDESSAFPTLEEAQNMASQNAVIAHSSRIDRLPEKPSYSSQTEITPTETVDAAKSDDNDDLWEAIDDEELVLLGHKIPEELVSKLLPPEIGVVKPLYKTEDDQSLIATPPEVFETLRKFGHETFRAGQEKAVMRILSGQSTLVTLSTGSGKSLCYQLPAYLYSKRTLCITLVISPLVSLMDDQVTGVPNFLSAACLHTGQAPSVREKVIHMVKEGQVNILLVSPEAVVAGEKSTGFGALLRQLPPIAFACIDEAHCISQWSHNFRPSYLMVCRVLREKLGVKTVLALTATATKSTAESIIKHLNIHDGMAGVISDVPMPRNLLLTVSRDENRDLALITLVQSERFKECDSIIVYCTRREECTRISGLLRVSLQDINNRDKSNSKLSSIAEAYHAGLSSHRRKVVQKAFMSGQTRIVVATVAFGMGLNKPDIRSVIHYNMPGTFEGYVQEVGRAGRDGLRAHCHLFLHPKEDNDKWELRRHIYANGVDRHTIRRLLQKVFIPCSCAKANEKEARYKCPGHEVAIPVDETVEALDITEQSISTLLCYLELHPKRFITVLSSVYVKARVSSYNGPQALKFAAQSSPPLAMAIALDLQKGISHDTSSVIEFPVVDVASAIGWDSGVVKSHLKQLEWKTVHGASKRSPISVRYDTLGLRIKAPGNLTEDELDEALDALFSRAQRQESTALRQLEIIGLSLHKFSLPSVNECLTLTEEINIKSDELKGVIRNYFNENCTMDIDYKKPEKLKNESEIIGDVRCLVTSYRDNSFTGRAVARIFHGIQSPNYPAYVWAKCRFWRIHLQSDFNAICQIATKEILALR